MYRIIFNLCIVFYIVSPSLPLQNNYRRYNVDQESFKLYGEDFKSVLKKFRRTPDYLMILQDKLVDLKTSAKEMSLQVLHYYHGKLEERVNELIPTITTTVAGPPLKIKRDYDKSFRALGHRRQDEPTTEAVENSLQKIHNLDNYKVFESQLSVAERNSLKDVGFEFAGKIIHLIIENMGSKADHTTTTEEKFTHVPEDEKKAEETTTSTTTHPPVHAVKHETAKEGDAATVTVKETPKEGDAAAVTVEEPPSTEGHMSK